MSRKDLAMSRRRFLAGSAAAGVGLASAQRLVSAKPKSAAPPDKALIGITLDLEMMWCFPTWDQEEWNYDKGNLDDAAKRYSVEAARRVKARGGCIHYFVVGAVFEQENVDWLKELVAEGHPIGNHTYDHVYVRAQKPEELQFLFRRAPWLIHGKTPRQVIEESIRMTTMAMKHRLGIEPAGFRTPGGFSMALNDRPDVQQIMLDQGFDWISCRYPSHPVGERGEKPTKETLDAILKAQEESQPFVYPTGLIDVPMSPISDVNAFRNARWSLDDFLEVTRMGVEWAIERRACFDFLAHPSGLGIVDPEFKTVDLICDLVAKAGDRAAIVDLGTMAQRAKRKA